MALSRITDVARMARVSVGTVSRVLHRHPTVSSDKLKRVNRAIATLNYAPRQRKASMADVNPLERKTVLLLTLGMDRSLATLPVVAAAIGGVEQAIGRANANLLMANLTAADRVPEIVRRKKIDGVILKGALQGDLIGQSHPPLIDLLQRLPTVWVLGRPEGAWGDVVQVNDMTVGQLAAAHLISQGHRHLGFISPKPSQVILMRRQASFTYFAQQWGAKVTAYTGDNRNWTFPSRAVDDVDMVQGLVDRILKARQRPTALFAPDDSVGAMTARALAARGLVLGRDMSLLSCNNETSLLVGIHPSLATLDVHAHEIGCRAVEQLAWRLTHRDATCVDIGLEPTLIPGASIRKMGATPGQRPLATLPRKDLCHEVKIPATTAALHGDAFLAGVLLE